MEFNPRIYNRLIDPLTAGLRRDIISASAAYENIIELACGTGKLARQFAKEKAHVLGVDLDPGMIAYAFSRKEKELNGKLDFAVADLTKLSGIVKNKFHAATMSLALHQFDPALWELILVEAFKVSDHLIIGDYNDTLPGGFYGGMVYVIERLAGKEHYKNFRSFLKEGGVPGIADKYGYEVKMKKPSGSGVFASYLLQLSH